MCDVRYIEEAKADDEVKKNHRACMQTIHTYTLFHFSILYPLLNFLLRYAPLNTTYSFHVAVPAERNRLAELLQNFILIFSFININGIRFCHLKILVKPFVKMTRINRHGACEKLSVV